MKITHFLLAALVSALAFSAFGVQAKEKREALKDFVARNAKVRVWDTEHPEEYSKIIAQLVKIPENVAYAKQVREKRFPQPIDAQVFALQQNTIDLYFSAGLIDKKLKATDLLDDSSTP